MLKAPRDSKGTPAAFVRGVYDLPESIKEIERKTGGLIGYVGEWHTHPMGGSELSYIDRIAVRNLRAILDPVRLPTLVTIVTPDDIHPHFFEPGSPPIQLGQRDYRTLFEYMFERLSTKRKKERS